MTCERSLALASLPPSTLTAEPSQGDLLLKPNKSLPVEIPASDNKNLDGMVFLLNGTTQTTPLK